jgi:hypothetical protein
MEAKTLYHLNRRIALGSEVQIAINLDSLLAHGDGIESAYLLFF